MTTKTVGPDERGFITEDCGCKFNRLSWVLCPLHRAAPKLLEALKYLVAESDQDMDEDYNPHSAPLALAHAAIAEAEPR